MRGCWEYSIRDRIIMRFSDDFPFFTGTSDLGVYADRIIMWFSEDFPFSEENLLKVEQVSHPLGFGHLGLLK